LQFVAKGLLSLGYCCLSQGLFVAKGLLSLGFCCSLQNLSPQKSLELTLVLDALDAAAAAAHIFATPDLPPEVYMEEVRSRFSK